ncbi:MAG: hypothetical protein Q8P28_04325 [Deltaproteobacteria bacterium]|nr:hypothetical protein [Deltaproteobacteria bacterium]
MENNHLYNFVYWLIHAQLDCKFKHRDKICETVKRLGKEAVLDELMRQGKDTFNLNEAVIMARTIRDMEC